MMLYLSIVFHYLSHIFRLPYQVNYAYSIDGKKWKKAGGEYAMGKGRWIGSKIGFFAVDPNKTGRKGFIDIDWFRISR